MIEAAFLLYAIMLSGFLLVICAMAWLLERAGVR